MNLKQFINQTNTYDFVQKASIFLVILVNLICLHTTNNNFNVNSLGQLHATNPLIWFFYLTLAALWVATCHLEKIKKNVTDLENKTLEFTKISQEQKNALDFVIELEKGNLEADYKIDETDKLGQVLNNLRKRLKSNELAEEQRKVADNQQRWMSDGLAKFSEILRQDKNNDLKLMSEKIISNLIKYLAINQGGVFLISEDETGEDKYFELIAAFAYDRKKYLQQKLQWGEGLIGACAIEKQTILITEIPEDYLTITSGLGGAKPKCLLLVPLMLEDEVFGVIELASFKVFEEHEQKFIEKVAESIAATLFSIKVNKRTSILLEKSQEQAANLATQEEELRQNMEELKTIQESLEESQAKTRMIFENAVDAIVTINERGIIDLFNPAAEKLFGFKAQDVIGENIKLIMPMEFSKDHDTYIKNYLNTGHKKILGMAREAKGRTQDGRVFPIEIRVEEAWLGDKRMFVGILRDITERIRLEEEMKQQIEELRTQDEELRQNLEELETTQMMIEEREAKIRVIFENALDTIITINEHGKIEQFNPSAEILFGYSANEIIGENVNKLMPKNHSKNHDEYLKKYMQTGEKHIIGKAREEKGRKKDGTTFPIEIRVNEAYVGEKRLFIGMLRDITERKMAEEEINQQIEEMNAQAEEMRQSFEELRVTQENLQNKERKQEEEISYLTAENKKRIEAMERLRNEQDINNAETKKLYENEIDAMFKTWTEQLESMENKLNNKKA